MNTDVKKKQERIRAAARWSIYYLALVIEYIFITTFPLDIPLPLLPLATALCISVFEDPFDSAVTGCATGLMIDAAEGTLIGMNGIIIMWCCLISSLLFYFVLRRHIVNIVLITAAAVFIQTGFRYIFYYFIWGYDESGKIYIREFLPIIVTTVISSPLFYLFVKMLHSKLGIINETYIEQKSDDIVRE